MLRKFKLIILTLVLGGSLALTAAALSTPAGSTSFAPCVAVCDPNPCLCPSNKVCVIWVSPLGGPCIGPGGNCNDVCIGP